MIKVYPSILNGTLKAVASKSYAQRLLFAAAMPSRPTIVANSPLCDDINTTLEVLSAFGCRIAKSKKDEILVDPFAKNAPLQELNFDFKDSGTTARLALTICSAMGFKANCVSSPSLEKRYQLPLISRMALRGIKFTGFSFPLEMSGRLEPGEYVFRGDEGSQYISSIMYALPLLSADSKIILETPLVDEAFVEITTDILKKFRIKIEKTDYGYFVPGRQKFESPNHVKAENDWGLASMWITAAAACSQKGGSITVTDLPKKSPQMYRDLKPLLSLIAQDFRSVNIDASKCPSLAPLFAAFALMKGAEVSISGVPQLKYKETDQFDTLASIALELGTTAKKLDDGIIIYENPNLNITEKTIIDCKNDPWIFMSFVLSSVVCDKPFAISNEKTAEKIYKNFLDDFRSVGGKFEIE